MLQSSNIDGCIQLLFVPLHCLCDTVHSHPIRHIDHAHIRTHTTHAYKNTYKRINRFSQITITHRYGSNIVCTCNDTIQFLLIHPNLTHLVYDTQVYMKHPTPHYTAIHTIDTSFLLLGAISRRNGKIYFLRDCRRCLFW